MFPYRRLPSHITGLYIFTVINFLILCHMALVQADISVISLKTNETVVPFMADMPAYFGGHIGYDGIWGQTVYSDPANACLEIQPPPKNSTIEIPGVKWFVLIVRGSCTFSKKVLNAQEAGYDVAIVHNLGSNQLEPMGPDKEKGITIPSVFIGESDGMSIKKLYTYDKGYVLQISPDLPFSLNPYILPFAVGVGACLIIMMLVMIIKCVRDRNRRRRHRLPTRLLKQLPIKKFKKNDPYDMCAICLDEYIEGEKLRVLPCNHTYHTKCIDPWLTESRRTCPVCKRKVLPRTNRNRRRILSSLSGTDSESDSDRDSDGGSGQANEHTPLLAPESRGNINLGERDMGRTNQSVIWDEESTGNSPTPTLPRSVQEGVPSTSSSPGGRYQSFTPTYSIGNLSLAGMLLFPPNNPANELLSSGEHSLNGEVTDFAPVETQPLADESENQSRGPVEIAVDVATRGTSASLWGTSPTNQRNTSSRGDCDLVV